jgi:copper(I)-binding protein
MPKLGTIFLLAASLTLPLTAHAADYRQGNIEIGQPWARATPEGAGKGAAYLLLKNHGMDPDTLIAAQSQIADRLELHEHIQEGGVMKMRKVSGGIAIPPGGTVQFKPGGYHIMLLGLKQRLQEGQQIPIKLTFAKAGELTVNAQVEKTEPHSTHSH